MEKNMDKGFTPLHLEKDMKGNGWKIKRTDLECYIIHQESFMKDSGRMIKYMVKENYLTRIMKGMMVILKMERNMV